MNIQPEIAISIGGALCSIAMSYGIVQSKLKDVCLWRDKHDVWSNALKSDFDKDIHHLSSLSLVQGEQYKEIIRRLDLIEKKFDSIDERRKTNR